MDRRKALKCLGLMAVCVGGQPVLAKKPKLVVDSASQARPTDYIFYEEGLRNIIIMRKNGEELRIPFNEIVEALTK